MNRLLNFITDAISGKVAALRSPQWASVRKSHLLNDPVCRACNGTDKLQVHHIRPFHLYPELELDPSNLMTLCESSDKECHLILGHNGNFKDYNAEVLSDVKQYRIKNMIL